MSDLARHVGYASRASFKITKKRGSEFEEVYDWAASTIAGALERKVYEGNSSQGILMLLGNLGWEIPKQLIEQRKKIDLNVKDSTPMEKGELLAKIRAKTEMELMGKKPERLEATEVDDAKWEVIGP